jgi:RNA polymerase sigma factor (sigma-70 family)
MSFDNYGVVINAAPLRSGVSAESGLQLNNLHKPMRDQDTIRRFENHILPHLSAAYNLARWLAQNDHDAEDIVQDSCLRAFKFFDGFRGGDGRAWLLRIVRNTCYTWLQHNRSNTVALSSSEDFYALPSALPTPEEALIKQINVGLLHQAMQELPIEFREVLVLRDLEDLSYKEIAGIIDIPLGTVMSRLARGRKRLAHLLNLNEESYHGV